MSTGLHRSRSREGRVEAADEWMVQERLSELEANGSLPAGSLDEHAQALLKKSDPNVAMAALNDWERSDLRTRRNPSACMVSMLRRIADKSGRDRWGNGQAGGDDEMAKQQLEDLLAEMEGQVDESAIQAVKSLEPHQGVGILSDLRQQGGAVRKPSAFVMSAVRRYTDGKAGGSGSESRSHRGGGGGRGEWDSYDSRGSYPSGGRGGRHQSAPSDDLWRQIEGLMRGTDIDESARSKLSELSPEDQVTILQDLSRGHGRVRNQSAFVISNAKLAREGRLKRFHPDEGYDNRYDDRDYGRQREDRNRGRHDRGSWQARKPSMWDKLDDKAKAELESLSEADRADLLNELENKADSVRNPSAFVCSVSKRYYDKSSQHRGREDSGNRRWEAPREAPRTRSRSRHRNGSTRSATSGEDDQRQQVANFVANCDLLDQKAKDALCSVDPLQALDIMQQIASKGSSIRNHSAFVTSACREVGQSQRPRWQADEPSFEHQVEAGGDGQASARPIPAEEWRSMDLVTWLLDVDNGKGFLTQYQDPLLANYDTLEQIMELYVTSAGDGHVHIDQMFFDDLKVEKVGHKRLFEKWFKDRM